jgi:hypothetical protein
VKNVDKRWAGEGSYADGKVLRIAGIEIVKTNNLPKAVVANGTTQAGTGNRYAGDSSKVAAPCQAQIGCRHREPPRVPSGMWLEFTRRNLRHIEAI